MKKELKEYFSFSKTEQLGILTLLIIIVLLFVANIILPYFIKETPTDFSQFQKEIDEFLKEKAKGDSIKIYDTLAYTENSQVDSLFYFDPNQLDTEKWKQLGLSDKQIKIIKNYEAKGGRFRKKEDLKKIYSISDELYKRLEPFILLPNEEELEKEERMSYFDLRQPVDDYSGKKTSHQIQHKKTQIIIELNSADNADLVQLKGIGEVYSERIINYRENLGGFIKKEQLLEVYGIDSCLFESLADNIIIDTTRAEKININEISAYELSKHPYIDYPTAKKIINIRKQCGQFTDLSEISYAVSDSLFQKITPYLRVK